MAGWLDQEALDWTSACLSRALVLLSFSTHLIVILCAGVRRHKASGVRWFFLWLMFPLAEKASTYALSKLFFGSTSSEQQKLIAFWAPFLLLNLGRGDNICALYLQDNELSNRERVGAILEVVASIYGAYAHIGGDISLLPAFLVMLVLGLCKYWERVEALRKGRMDRIRSTIEDNDQQSGIIYPGVDGELDNKKALKSAHSLLHITKGAFTDMSFTLNGDDSSRKWISFKQWNNLIKVVEMELSLMYDIMYTKSTMVHAWTGYFIRFISPIGTTIAFVLFSLHGRDGQSRFDIIMTYILLVTTFLLDMTWLLTALGSRWAREVLKDTKPLLEMPKLCGFILNLQLSLSQLHISPTGSHRRWSGIIGQVNLLQDCTEEAATSWTFSGLVKRLASDENWKEYQYSTGLKIRKHERCMLFERIFKKLESPFGKNKDNKKKKESLEQQPACPPPMPPFHCPDQHPCYPCPNPGYACPDPPNCPSYHCYPPPQYYPGGYGDPPAHYYPSGYSYPPPQYYPGGYGDPPAHYYPGGYGYPPPHYYPGGYGDPPAHYYPGGYGYPPPHYYPGGYGDPPAHYYPGGYGYPPLHPGGYGYPPLHPGGYGYPPLHPGGYGYFLPQFSMTPDEGANISRDRALDEHLGFDPELSEVILTWHIATDIFLQCSDKDDPLPKYKKVIEALSDYMMFLWVVRPAMLPGLLLRSHYQRTRKTLVGIWESEDCKNHFPEGGYVTEKHRLASFLLDKDKGAGESSSSSSSQSHSEESLFLSDGIQYAEVLLLLHRETDTDMTGILKEVKMGKQSSERLKKLMPKLWSDRKWSTRKKSSEEPDKLRELLSLIFDAWVRLLIFASKRCSRDSHAKQLGGGGELITIVWILIEHASTFGINNTIDESAAGSDDEI